MPLYQEKQFELFEIVEKGQRSVPSIVTPVDNYTTDFRMCFTALVFLPKAFQKKVIQKVIQPLADTDPQQYYYPSDSMHVTIQNIRNIHEPPLYSEQDIQKVKMKFGEIIPRYRSFPIELRGLFQLPSSIAVRGYSDERLHELVVELRRGLTNIGIPDDKKYASDKIFFGTSTVCRFTKKPNKVFYNVIQELKEINIGVLKVDEVALVTTNTVCYPNKTNIIARYKLQ